MNERFDPDFGQVVPLRGLPNALIAKLEAVQPEYRVAPHNIDAEQALLGAILINNAAFAKVSEFLKPEHFMEEVHRRIFETTASLISDGKLVTPITLKTYLGDGDLGGITVMTYLARLAAEATTVLNAGEYGRAVYELAMRRRLITIGENVTSVAYEAPVEANPLVQVEAAETALAALKEVIIGAGGGLRRATSVTSDDAGAELLADITVDLQGKGPTMASTGIVQFDREIGGGLPPSFLITMAARTSMGKSIVGVEAASAVGRNGRLAIYHSLEMSRKQIMARRAASWLFGHGGHELPYEQIMRRRGLNEKQANLVGEALYGMRGEHFHIEDGGGRTIGDIATASDRLTNLYARRGVSLGVVVIDHAHIVKPSRSYNREDEGFKEVADGALQLAKHLDVTVLLLAQCNRKTEARGADERRPTLADIRGAGAFEENSDVVAFLYRPAYYVERSGAFRSGKTEAQQEYDTCRNDFEIIIDKNRAGRANHIVRAWIDPALNAVRNLQYGS